MLRAVDAIVEAADIATSRTERASPQTLRNTFAAELFENDVTPERVGHWLGFMQPVSANRLHRARRTWRDNLEKATIGPQETDAALAESPRLV